MMARCKLNPCCGATMPGECTPPPQIKPNEGWDAYEQRTAKPASEPAGDVRGSEKGAEGLHGPFGYLVIVPGLDEEHWHMRDDPETMSGYVSLPLFTKVDPFDYLPEPIAKPASSPAGEWQPMSTAPKDGTRIDAWVRSIEQPGKEYRHCGAYWNAAQGEWQLGPYHAGQFEHRPEVTHWMPIPERPISTALSQSASAGRVGE